LETRHGLLQQAKGTRLARELANHLEM
jgi:hypothetical protein